MTKYNSIDILKFVASFFVVTIHISLFSDINPYLNLFIANGLSRLAVPFYFLASAFFFYKKNVELDEASQKQSLIKYTKRMLILYFGWFLISLPKTIYERFIYNGKSFLQNFFQFIKSFFLTSTFSGSWFLISCVFSAWLLFLVYNKFSSNKQFANKSMLIIGIMCYFLCVITSTYGNVFYKIGLGELYSDFIYYVAKPYTSILVGVPYFVLGGYIAKTEVHLTKTSKVFGIASLILLFVEVFVTYKFDLQQATDCYLMLLPTAYFLFVWIKDIKVELKINPVKLRNTSTIIFFSHFIWIFIIEVVEVLFIISANSVYRFVFVSLLSLVTSAIFCRLSKFKMFLWLRYLY